MSDVPTLDYRRHLFLERDLRTVTSNTRRDGEELRAEISQLDGSNAVQFAFRPMNAE